MSKFDAIRASGDMMPTAMGTPALDGKKNIFFILEKKFILNHLRGRGMPLARFSKDFFRFFCSFVKLVI